MAGSSLPVGVESSGAKSTVDVRTMQDSSAFRIVNTKFQILQTQYFWILFVQYQKT